MNEKFEPSPDFVAQVMARVRAYEAEKASFIAWLIASRPVRFLLACGGTVCGILTAAPAF